MPLEIHERHTSRALNVSTRNPWSEFEYVVLGGLDENQVRDALVVQSPPVHPDYPFLVREEITVKRLGGKVYDGIVRYTQLEGAALGDPATNEPPTRPEPEQGQEGGHNDAIGSEFAFDTTGGTETMYTSIATMLKKGPGPATNVPDFCKAMNVTFDKVNGVEVYSPKFEWSITARLSRVTHAYLDTLKKLTGTANRFKWFHRLQEDCLFLGASGGFRPGEGWSVTYRFADSPTEMVSVEPISPVKKRGWQYLWCGYEDDFTAGRSALAPYGLYIERVYPRSDFRHLKIGGGHKLLAGAANEASDHYQPKYDPALWVRVRDDTP
jgi:hypothetical protein